MQKFIDILKMTQEQLFDHIEKELKELGYKHVKRKEKYIYAKGMLPVMLVSHTDTVHKEEPKIILHDREQELMWSPQGIGGDDRCGIYSMLKIAEDMKPHLLFCADEEIGGVGASIASKELKPENVKFLIELDRKGSEDAVFYQCANEDFKKYIEDFGFKENFGSYSDICDLSPAWDLASVNLSIGYYNQHTLQEYIKLEEMEKTIEKVRNVLKDSVNAPVFDFQEEFMGGFDLYESYDMEYSLRQEAIETIYYEGDVIQEFAMSNGDLISRIMMDNNIGYEEAAYELLEIALYDIGIDEYSIDTSIIESYVEEYVSAFMEYNIEKKYGKDEASFILELIDKGYSEEEAAAVVESEMYYAF